jgi:hypothetical protein
MTTQAWPLLDLRLGCRGVLLRPVTEADLPLLAAIQPDDYEHEPHAELLAGLDRRQNRARLCHQSYWRSVGTWSPSAWCLEFAVQSDDAVVGVTVSGFEACRPWFGLHGHGPAPRQIASQTAASEAR